VSTTEGHFIRSHFPAPEIGSTDWSLPVTGEVFEPLNLSYDDLLKMPSHEVTSLMECAGNSRSTMQPPAEGVQWNNGGLSVSRWKGVSMKTVLDQAGFKGTASDVLFVGADSGTESHAEGTLVYEMSVPMEKLLHPDSILAYEMNGETLPKDHGYPIRLITPGWYGMTSVKWVVSIVVMDRPNRGFQSQAGNHAEGEIPHQQPREGGYSACRQAQGLRGSLVRRRPDHQGGGQYRR
jgi:DMSO/TMAO reductase YedYZ molybdopterin-dependent catalytic subunit